MDRSERFTAIFGAHRLEVAAYVRRRAGADVAQEVVADTFLAAWRHVDALPEDPLPWLYRAAAFELANRRRRMARDATLGDLVHRLAAPPRESDVADGVVSASTWRAALDALGKTDREVLLLAAWERLAPERAAAVLGCSAVAYRVRLHRARRRLDDLVADGPGPSADALRASAPGAPPSPVRGVPPARGSRAVLPSSRER